MVKVCYRCFQTSPTLKKFFKKKGKRGKCPSCDKVNALCLEAEELEPLFESLRNLYEVSEPGEHYVRDPETGDSMFGSSDDLVNLLQGQWDIFSNQLDHEVMRNIIREVWPGWDETSEYTYEDLWYREARETWEQLSRRLKHERRFFPKHQYGADNIDVESEIARYIARSDAAEFKEPLYRAQKNLSWEMRAPRPAEVKVGGRANPAGIAYLYLASTEETALAEVRAEPGDKVRIGRYLLTSPRLIDLRNLRYDQIDPFVSGQDLKVEINCRGLLLEFAKILSRPVGDNLRELDYVPTQYLAELIAHKEFDGIIFRSSLSDGVNIVLFDPCHATLQHSHVVEVKSKKYVFVECEDRDDGESSIFPTADEEY